MPLSTINHPFCHLWNINFSTVFSIKSICWFIVVLCTPVIYLFPKCLVHNCQCIIKTVPLALDLDSIFISGWRSLLSKSLHLLQIFSQSKCQHFFSSTRMLLNTHAINDMKSLLRALKHTAITKKEHYWNWTFPLPFSFPFIYRILDKRWMHLFYFFYFFFITIAT